MEDNYNKKKEENGWVGKIMGRGVEVANKAEEEINEKIFFWTAIHFHYSESK